jgi:outer membrane lipoprotein-sorting protein
MAKHDQSQAELVAAYWSTLREAAGALPPEHLPSETATLVRQLESRLRPPEPDPLFAARLGHRLRAEAAAVRAAAEARPSHRGWWRLRVHPARAARVPATLAAAVLIAATAAGVMGWSDRSRAVSAHEIIQRVQGAATAPTAAGFRSFVVTETAEVRPLDPQAGEAEVRTQTSRWFEAPGRWRREVASTVVGPDGVAVSQGGLTTVSDGATLWIHRLRDNLVTVRSSGQAQREGELGPVPEVTGGLSALLEQATSCYSPKLAGSDSVAGRPTYVIDFGRSRCATPLQGAAVSVGEPAAMEWTIWVDKSTYLILKSVQDVDGKVYATNEATSVQYDVAIDPKRFTFAPPANSRVKDTRTTRPKGPEPDGTSHP